MNINDCIHTALGPGQINDLLLAYYQDNGATSNDINDAAREFLAVQGADLAQINDMWYQFLRDTGYTGALSDMKLQFWCIDGGDVGGDEGGLCLDWSQGQYGIIVEPIPISGDFEMSFEAAISPAEAGALVVVSGNNVTGAGPDRFTFSQLTAGQEVFMHVNGEPHQWTAPVHPRDGLLHYYRVIAIGTEMWIEQDGVSSPVFNINPAPILFTHFAVRGDNLAANMIGIFKNLQVQVPSIGTDILWKINGGETDFLPSIPAGHDVELINVDESDWVECPGYEGALDFTAATSALTSVQNVGIEGNIMNLMRSGTITAIASHSTGTYARDEDGYFALHDAANPVWRGGRNDLDGSNVVTESYEDANAVYLQCSPAITADQTYSNDFTNVKYEHIGTILALSVGNSVLRGEDSTLFTLEAVSSNHSLLSDMGTGYNDTNILAIFYIRKSNHDYIKLRLGQVLEDFDLGTNTFPNAIHADTINREFFALSSGYIRIAIEIAKSTGNSTIGMFFTDAAYDTSWTPVGTEQIEVAQLELYPNYPARYRVDDLPPIPVGATAVTVDETYYTFPAANIDVTSGRITLVIATKGIDWPILKIGSIDFLSSIGGNLVLSDGTNSCSIPEDAFTSHITIEYNDAAMSLSRTGGGTASADYVPITPGLLEIHTTTRGFRFISLVSALTYTGTVADGEIITVNTDGAYDFDGVAPKTNAKPKFVWSADNGIHTADCRDSAWDGVFHSTVSTDQVAINSSQSYVLNIAYSSITPALAEKTFATAGFYQFTKSYDDFNIYDNVLTYITIPDAEVVGTFPDGELVTGDNTGATGRILETSDTRETDHLTIIFEKEEGTSTDRPGQTDFDYNENVSCPSGSGRNDWVDGMRRTFNYKSLRIRGPVATVFIGSQGAESMEQSIVPEATGPTMPNRGVQLPFEWKAEEVEFLNGTGIDTVDAEFNYWQRGELGNTTKYVSKNATYPDDYTKIFQAQVSNGAYTPSNLYHDFYYLDDTWHRVIFSDEKAWTPEATSNVEVQIPITWTATQISFKLRQGEYATPVGKYMYIFDASGTTPINAIGMLMQ